MLRPWAGCTRRSQEGGGAQFCAPIIGGCLRAVCKSDPEAGCSQLASAAAAKFQCRPPGCSQEARCAFKVQASACSVIYPHLVSAPLHAVAVLQWHTIMLHAQA